MFRRLIFSVIFLFAIVNTVRCCGYDSCPVLKENAINVHLVPHSHDDVGWLKTVDQYYYGSKNYIQEAGVQYILDSVIVELLKDPSRRFIYVESEFLMKWWREQNDDMRAKVRMLVNEGRLEITGGAWSMNDEAAVHYQSVIDQFTLGLSELKRELGTCARPRIGWQIDPFGHSSEMASIFAGMGYDAEFFARIDWLDKRQRLSTKSAEMIWKADENLGTKADIFTGVMYNHYSAPPGFCFDVRCSNEPIIDGNSFDNNVKERVDTFIAYIRTMAESYRSTHLLVPMGDDFNYINANMNFKNMDKLIKYVNARQSEGSNMNIFYSTPACYVKALHAENLTWPVKTEDFFPYSTNAHSYWTGYFSSRPTQKRFERYGNHMLQVAKQLVVLARLNSSNTGIYLDQLREVMGIMQHHDAITGTEKQLVAFDYARLLTRALNGAATNLLSPALKKLTDFDGQFETCLQLNVSYCDFMQESTNEFWITLFNPLSQRTTQYVRIPVYAANYEVLHTSGLQINSQVVPIDSALENLPERPSGTKHELIFSAAVEKVGSFLVRKKSSGDVKITEETPQTSGDIIVENSLVKLKFGEGGHLEEVTANGVSASIHQDFYYYKSVTGNNDEAKNQSSGAYIFRNDGSAILIGDEVKLKIYQGDLVSEVHQVFNEWVSQVIRIYEGKSHVEFEWQVGPIPIDDNIGKEVITKFTTDIRNEGVFWTDSNGRKLMRRLRNSRNDFVGDFSESISANYYPITACLAIEDSSRRLALLNDRAQGGSSVEDGAMELMLHRRILKDDSFGVGEALNETVNNVGLIARGKVLLLLNTANVNATVAESWAQKEMHLPYWLFFSHQNGASPKAPEGLQSLTNLPFGLNILTLEPFSTHEILMRLENFLDRNATAALTFNLLPLFEDLRGTEIIETTLDGNLLLNDMKRLKFREDNVSEQITTDTNDSLNAKKGDDKSKFDITVGPMQIRTFVITLIEPSFL